MVTDHADVARSYYAAIDEHAYDDLADLLEPGFVHERPDRTLEGRDRFVDFMREDRPMTDTTHAVDGVYRDDTDDEVAVRGRLLRDDERLFGFVDVFSFSANAVTRLRTYTD
ncbi:MAG: nuclear transport factor 2 family protein [Haloarculaceae archaeon]